MIPALKNILTNLDIEITDLREKLETDIAHRTEIAERQIAALLRQPDPQREEAAAELAAAFAPRRAASGTDRMPRDSAWRLSELGHLSADIEKMDAAERHRLLKDGIRAVVADSSPPSPASPVVASAAGGDGGSSAAGGEGGFE